jgi:RNA polymerase sigma factor (sigma-70 family)
VRLPAHVHEQQARYRRAVASLDALGDEASSRESIAEHLDVPVTALDQIEASLSAIRSLDAPLGPEESGTLADRIPDDESPDPTDQISRSEIRDVIESALDGLDGREMEILSRRFGLDGGPPQTLDSIGATLGLSRERVRQIERSVLDRLGEQPSVQSLSAAIR